MIRNPAEKLIMVVLEIENTAVISFYMRGHKNIWFFAHTRHCVKMLVYYTMFPHVIRPLIVRVSDSEISTKKANSVTHNYCKSPKMTLGMLFKLVEGRWVAGCCFI